MSKKTKKQTRIVYDPSSTISINGNVKTNAKSTKDGVNVSYNMDPYEEAAYNYSNKTFYENLPNVNVFSDDTVKNLNNQVKAFINRGVDTINSTYTPMIASMQNDVARRFGNTNNSVFMDNLNDIEAKRALAISDLAQDAEEKRKEIINNELQNRYEYLNFLNNYQNQVFKNMLSMLNLNQGFLNTNNAHLNGTNTSSGQSGSNLNSILNTALDAALGATSLFLGKK